MCRFTYLYCTRKHTIKLKGLDIIVILYASVHHLRDFIHFIWIISNVNSELLQVSLMLDVANGLGLIITPSLSILLLYCILYSHKN